jgi:hypothetical protein
LECKNIQEDKRRVSGLSNVWKWVRLLEYLICARVREGEREGER